MVSTRSSASSLSPGSLTRFRSRQAIEPSFRRPAPFAKHLDDPNLVMRAVERAGEVCPALQAGVFRLRKELPVAAGLGGGSADAAAVLRLLMRANPDHLDARQLHGIAEGIGADVPVCLSPRAAWMRGIGEIVAPVDGFAGPAAVLVNPGVPIATADVFQTLSAPKQMTPMTHEFPSSVATLDALVDFMRATGNDLEEAAHQIAPVVAEATAAIEATAGCLVAGMSGSGATCFGLFADADDASAAADTLSSLQPEWWVRATTLS